MMSKNLIEFEFLPDTSKTEHKRKTQQTFIAFFDVGLHLHQCISISRSQTPPLFDIWTARRAGSMNQ